MAFSQVGRVFIFLPQKLVFQYALMLNGRFWLKPKTPILVLKI